jgi:hypothetical protein
MGGGSSPCRGQIRIRRPISKLDRIQIRIRIINLRVLDTDATGAVKYVYIYYSRLRFFFLDRLPPASFQMRVFCTLRKMHIWGNIDNFIQM